jgi:hypothetical protein
MHGRTSENKVILSNQAFCTLFHCWVAKDMGHTRFLLGSSAADAMADWGHE